MTRCRAPAKAKGGTTARRASQTLCRAAVRLLRFWPGVLWQLRIVAMPESPSAARQTSRRAPNRFCPSAVRRLQAGSLPSLEARIVTDTSVTKVKSAFSPHGPGGQKYLASGVHVAMRLWEKETPGRAKPASRRDYETVGYVLAGRAELHTEGQMVLLEAGDSWVVPAG